MKRIMPKIINRIRVIFIEMFYDFYFIKKFYYRKGECKQCGKCCKGCPAYQGYRCEIYNKTTICNHDVFPRDKMDLWAQGIKDCGYYW